MTHPLQLLDKVPEIKTAEKVFRAIDHPLRKRILRLLETKMRQPLLTFLFNSESNSLLPRII